MDKTATEKMKALDGKPVEWRNGKIVIPKGFRVASGKCSVRSLAAWGVESSEDEWEYGSHYPAASGSVVVIVPTTTRKATPVKTQTPPPVDPFTIDWAMSDFAEGMEVMLKPNYREFPSGAGLYLEGDNVGVDVHGVYKISVVHKNHPGVNFGARQGGSWAVRWKWLVPLHAVTAYREAMAGKPAKPPKPDPLAAKLTKTKKLVTDLESLIAAIAERKANQEVGRELDQRIKALRAKVGA